MGMQNPTQQSVPQNPVNLIDGGRQEELVQPGTVVVDPNQQAGNDQQLQAAQQQQVNPLDGTPYQTVEQLAEGYKNLQSHSTQTNQSFKELESRYNQAVDMIMTNQRQQVVTQTPQVQRLHDLGDDELRERAGKDFKGTLTALAREIADETIATKIAPLQESLQSQQYLYNQQAVSGTLDAIERQYGAVDPNYQENLKSAVDLVAGEWRPMAQNNPAKALNDAYQLVLGRQLINPDFLTKFSQNAQKVQNTQILQKQMAAPQTGGSNTFQSPHAPAVQQNQLQQQPGGNVQDARTMARQISMYDEPQFFNPYPGQGVQIQYNETVG